MLELPLLDETRCVGCGDCVGACPTSCLEMVGNGPWLPRPGDCIQCALCVVVCPTDAVSLGEEL